MAGGSANGRQFREESSSVVKNEVSRGNPRGYHGHGVARMARVNHPSFEARNSTIMQKTETEGEIHFKRLLDKQLKKDVTMQQLSDQTRHFVKSSFYKPFTEEIVGKMELDDFKAIENRKAQLEHLQQCGLDQAEIKLWLSQHRREDSDCKIPAIEPTALRSRLEVIESKITAKAMELEKHVQSRDVRVLNRHEMEIEASLNCTDERNQIFQKLVRSEAPANVNTTNNFSDNLKTLEEEMFGHLKRRKRKRTQKKRGGEFVDQSSSATSIDDGEIQIATCSPRPIEDAEIRANKLSVEKIKLIPRFANYDRGEPNNVLYIKNLSRRVDDVDLSALFDRFSGEDGITPTIRLLSGKMHGQAFITFTNLQLAERALESVNGYSLYGKPIVIQYKRNVPS